MVYKNAEPVVQLNFETISGREQLDGISPGNKNQNLWIPILTLCADLRIFLLSWVFDKTKAKVIPVDMKFSDLFPENGHSLL